MDPEQAFLIPDLLNPDVSHAPPEIRDAEEAEGVRLRGYSAISADPNSGAGEGISHFAVQDAATQGGLSGGWGGDGDAHQGGAQDYGQGLACGNHNMNTL
jgi:hypothetical protein